MKKAVVGIVGVAALICAISAFLFLRNKSPKMEYIGGKYNRQYEYAGIFDTQIAETDNFTCSFEKGVFTDKELKDYSNQIYDDMQLIKKSVGSKYCKTQDVNIYILSDDRIKYPCIGKEVLFINKKSIVDSEYRYFLIQHLCQMGRCVKTYGLYTNIFNIKCDASKLDKLADYQEVLDMCAIWQMEDDNTSERKQVFDAAANSFAEYIISQNGIDYFLENKITKTTVEDWIKSKKLERFLDDDNSIMARDSDFQIYSSFTYDVIVKGDGSTFSLDNGYFGADDYYRIMLDCSSEQLVKKQLKEFMTKYHIDKDNYGGNVDSISYFLRKNDNIPSFTSIEDDNKVKITLNTLSPQTMIHELGHAFIKADNRDKYWMAEGLPEYISCINYTGLILKEEIKKYSESSDGAGFREYMSKRRHRSDNLVLQYYDYARNEYVRGNSELSKWLNNFKVGFQIDADVQGNDMTYTDAMCFVGYLIEKHGMEKVLKFMNIEEGAPYEEYFGKPYDKLKEEWMDAVNINR